MRTKSDTIAAANTPEKKRKQRRSTSNAAAEDMAILRAVAAIKPHSAMWGQTKKRWQRVADTVLTDLGGSSDDVTGLHCQARYETLVSRFMVKQALGKEWPPDEEFRELLEEAANEKRQRKAKPTKADTRMQAALTMLGNKGPTALSLETLRKALVTFPVNATATDNSVAEATVIPNQKQEDGDDERDGDNEERDDCEGGLSPKREPQQDQTECGIVISPAATLSQMAVSSLDTDATDTPDLRAMLQSMQTMRDAMANQELKFDKYAKDQATKLEHLMLAHDLQRRRVGKLEAELEKERHARHELEESVARDRDHTRAQLRDLEESLAALAEPRSNKANGQLLKTASTETQLAALRAEIEEERSERTREYVLLLQHVQECLSLE